MTDHQPITDAITDTPQRAAMQPQHTTGETPLAAQVDEDGAKPAAPQNSVRSDKDTDALHDQLTEDLSVQGGE
ncbi:hypothetical protein [Sphingomonas sp. MA1305]|uniref:hypothetical protein n=1 Tax=Sphingomonas sp. MA1305 TaxID=2479204 RepID=UPI0018E04FDC|nr:hypothetical protein [Sphingomonas sp. MA1305]